MTNGHEKSDSAIVAMKPANKVAHPAAEQSAAEPATAEPVEPRAGTKGNASQQTMPWAQSQTSMPHALERIRKVARERKKEKFISLFHHISVRSEEHTSELQSPYDLVCRLLLEKKKTKK